VYDIEGLRSSLLTFSKATSMMARQRKNFPFKQHSIHNRQAKGPDKAMSVYDEESASKTVTLQDVATAAGVTVGTASKALNGQGKLRQETRERVLTAARQLGFRARGVPATDHVTILLLTSVIHTRFSIPLLTGLEQEVARYEKPVSVLMWRAFNQEHQRQHLEGLLSRPVDGIIFMADDTNLHPPVPLPPEHQQIPHLYVYGRITDHRELCLLPDDEQGGRLATEHLLSQGRREIATITGPLYFEAVHLRARGMRQVLLEHNIPFSETRILTGPWSIEWGYEATQQLLERDPAVDAIFCGSDEIACGVIEALQASGRRVPEDVSVIGFDNWSSMVYRVRPHITTIDMGLPELGRRAGQYLLAMIEGRETPHGALYQPCTLVVRDSSAIAKHSAVQKEDVQDK
jgi:LacI family transcriptional regulator